MPCRFPCMDFLFPSFTPTVTAKLTALLNDAVAGYQECDRVCAYRLTVRIQVRLMETPPSASSAEPVVKLDASDAR
jgi:hypothetical protein